MAAWLETFLLREWQRVSVWQVFLQPVSWFFRAVVWARSKAFSVGLFRSSRIGCPVVVVGNISVGGTGKTPLVLALVTFFQQQGKTPGILTRGYMTNANAQVPTLGSVIHVVPGAAADDPSLSDEALLLSERSKAPVFAGANRVDAANQLLQSYPATDLLVGDDGLQHYAMRRDVEIAVVDASRGFGNGFCLPAGPLREPISRLASVDCIVLNITDRDVHLQAEMPEKTGVMASLVSQLSSVGVPFFEMAYADAQMQKLAVGEHSVESMSPAAFAGLHAGKRIVAIAGIGNPDRFFAHLTSLGMVLQGKVAFPDHHRFTESDLRNIDADVVLMTEKDAVKCRQFAALDKRLWSMRVDAKLPDAFYEFVLKKATHVHRSEVA